MAKLNLWEKLLYKKECSGKVEKDGEVYLKYRKVRRFRFFRVKTILVILAVILLSLVYLFLSNLLIPPNKYPVTEKDRKALER